MSATPKNRRLSADSLIPRQEAAAASLPKATVHDADGLEPLWNTATAAEFLGISVPTVQRMRSDGSGPRFVRLGRGKRSRIAYRRSDLAAWIEANTYASTAQYPKGK